MAAKQRIVSPVMLPMTLHPRRPVNDAKKRWKEIEAQLWQAYIADRCDERRNDLWLHYQSLVRYLAERLKTKLPQCIDTVDLIGAGELGLREAIVKFDTKRGLNFQTYCVPRIRGAMLDSIREMDWVPRLIRSKASKRGHVFGQLRAKLRRDPTEEEMAKAMKLTVQALRALEAEIDTKSQLQAASVLKAHPKWEGDDQDPMESFQIKTNMQKPLIEPGDEIREIALRGLNEKERVVVDCYYFQDMSMKQIGAQMGLSESRICQIHFNVMAILRRRFADYMISK